LARDGKAATQLPGATELARELAEWAGTNDGVDFTPDAIQTVSQLSQGLPRVINLLCDRSLEEAHASRLRIVDRPLVLTAAQVLGIGETGAPASPGAAARGTQPVPDETFWADSRTFSEADDAILQTADDAPGVVLGAHTAAAAPSQLPKYL